MARFILVAATFGTPPGMQPARFGRGKMTAEAKLRGRGGR